MKPGPSLAAFVVLSAVLAIPRAALAQSQKAQELASQDPDFASLSEEDKQAVLKYISSQIRGRENRVKDVDVVSLSGATVGELEQRRRKEIAARYREVVKDQDQAPRSTPEKTELVPTTVDMQPFGKLFADNDWELLEGSPEADALRKQIDDVMAKLAGAKGGVASIKIESSASTLRNTGKASKMTHLELSEKRARSAAEFVRGYLASKHKVSLDDDQVFLDFKGANGNGTSGPSSPYPCPKGDKYCAEGSCAAPEGLSKDDIADFYDQFKYVRVSMDVVNEPVVKTPGSDTPGEAHMVLVSVQVEPTKPRHRFRIRFKHHPKVARIRKHKRFKDYGDKCPVFSH